MTTRYFSFSVALALLWAGNGIPQVSSSKTSGKTLGLSATFSAAAMELARSVDSYTGVTEVGIPEISDALASASQQAHSPGELQSMKVLRTFLEDKLDNNTLRAQTVAKTIYAWKMKHSGASQAATDEAIATLRMETLDLPGMREMTRREDDCAAEMSRIFAAGTFHDPQHCSDVRLRTDEHAMMQFFPKAGGG
jgi:hypothetical protein